MVEDRRLGDAIAYVILTIGVLIVAFPVWLTFVASTWDAATVINGQMPLYPGPYFLENYNRILFVGTSSTTTRRSTFTMRCTSGMRMIRPGPFTPVKRPNVKFTPYLRASPVQLASPHPLGRAQLSVRGQIRRARMPIRRGRACLGERAPGLRSSRRRGVRCGPSG